LSEQEIKRAAALLALLRPEEKTLLWLSRREAAKMLEEYLRGGRELSPTGVMVLLARLPPSQLERLLKRALKSPENRRGELVDMLLKIHQQVKALVGA